MQDISSQECLIINGPNLLSTILQLSDSVFPTGGFTHSMGCESAVQRFQIKDERSNSLPYVKTSHTNCKDLRELINLDNHYSLTHSNHIANRSSKQQGRSFTHACSTTFNLPILKDIEKLIDQDQIEAYHEIVFGFVCDLLGINVKDTLDIYMFGVLRTMINSMVRLGKNMGPMKAQTLQYDLQNIIPNIIQRNLERKIDEVCTKFPLPDLVQASHDTLFSRLFYS